MISKVAKGIILNECGESVQFTLSSFLCDAEKAGVNKLHLPDWEFLLTKPRSGTSWELYWISSLQTVHSLSELYEGLLITFPVFDHNCFQYKGKKVSRLSNKLTQI